MNPRKRHKARKLAVQAVYQWQLAATPLVTLQKQYLDDNNNERFDVDYFKELIAGIQQEFPTLDKTILLFSTRKIHECDPVELAVLRIAVYELLRRIDIPYRVIINEALELNKTFGTDEGYKFVNGILDKLAAKLRPIEINQLNNE